LGRALKLFGVIIFSFIGVLGIIADASSQYFSAYHGDHRPCENGACAVYADKPSLLRGDTNYLCFRDVGQKGGIWALTSDANPQQAKCVFAGGYIDEGDYVYCQQGENCEATVMRNILNLKGYMEGLPYGSYKLTYNFSLFCKGRNWVNISENVFICSNNLRYYDYPREFLYNR